MRFVKCMISLGQFYVKCSLSAEGTAILVGDEIFESNLEVPATILIVLLMTKQWNTSAPNWKQQRLTYL